MKKKVILTALLLGAWAFGATHAAGESVPEMVKRHQKEKKVPGIAVTVYDTRTGARENIELGMANLELRHKVDQHSIFRIASITKIFTSLGITILAERKQLNISDSLSQYFPDYPRAGEITIYDLLHHSSGLPDFSDSDEFLANPAKPWAPQDLVNVMRNLPYQFDPGTSANYCNSNYLMLALIIEQVSGQSFAAYMRDRVIRPLGMKHTAVGSDTEIVRGRVAGYSLNGDIVENAEFVSVEAPFGTGDILSLPSDFVLLSRALRPGTLLNQDSITDMLKPVVLRDGSSWSTYQVETGLTKSFGYGWELLRTSDQDPWLISKGGAISGFHSFFLYNPETRMGIAASENLPPTDKSLEILVEAIDKKLARSNE
jgi:D-alanyl-D-alanine carboxypeptidase